MMRAAASRSSTPARSHPITLLATDALMFVGGGSASTAGGIKVTTIALLFLAITAEGKGDKNVRVFRRTVPERQPCARDQRHLPRRHPRPRRDRAAS